MMRVEELLDAYPRPIADLTYALRDVVRDTLPHAHERVIPGWKIIAYSKRTIFLYLAPAKTRVAVGFNMGRRLPDPEGMLVQLGRSRDSRNLLLTPDQDIPIEPLKALSVKAYELAH